MDTQHLGQLGSIWFDKYIVMQSLNRCYTEFNLLQFNQFSAKMYIAMMINLRCAVQPNVTKHFPDSRLSPS